MRLTPFLYLTCPLISVLFFFNDTATTEIYTLSLHDALPISRRHGDVRAPPPLRVRAQSAGLGRERSEEHTSELQSRLHLVCRLLLEKKKKINPLLSLTTILYLA